MGARWLYGIFLTAAAVFVCSVTAPTHLAREHLAIFCRATFPEGPWAYEKFFQEFQQRLSEALSVPPEAITFEPFKKTAEESKAYTVFTIVTPTLVVTDSVTTPETYRTYRKLWAEALETNEKVKQPFQLDDMTLTPVTDAPEVTEMSLTVEEGMDPPVPTITTRNDLLTALQSSSLAILQVRLTTTTLSTLKTSFDGFYTVEEALRRAASSILGVPDTRIVLYDIIQDDTPEEGVIVQFTVYPATDEELEVFSQKWAEAVTSQNPVLQTALEDVDFDFPAVKTVVMTSTEAPLDVTEAPTDPPETEAMSEMEIEEEEAAVSGGVVAGSVIGALAAAGAIGGGGYYYKRRLDQKRRNQQHTTSVTGDQTPSGERNGVDESSPVGLHHVNVEGATTPNPHNFHQSS